MNRLAIGILGAVLLAGGAASWQTHRAAQSARREQQEALTRQAGELARLAAENACLADLVAQTPRPAPLSQAQFRELLRLRSEVGQLRAAFTEVEALRQTNRLYQAALETGARAHQTVWTPEQLTFAGYGDPASAMKSTLWAWLNRDPAAYLAQCTPEEKAELEKAWAGASPEQIAAMFQRMAAFYSFAADGARMLGEKAVSDNEVILDLYFDRDGKSRRFALKKSGDRWQVDGLIAIFN